MKLKAIFLSILVIIGGLAVGWGVGNADTDNPVTDLEPLLYDKLKFKSNTDYLHDERKTEMKNTIPVKQFDINFDGSKQLPKRGDTTSLFQTAERGKKSTVAAKTSELGLFATGETAENLNDAVRIMEEKPATNSVRTMIFIGMIAIGMIVLFTFFLPRLVNEKR